MYAVLSGRTEYYMRNVRSAEPALLSSTRDAVLSE